MPIKLYVDADGPLRLQVIKSTSYVKIDEDMYAPPVFDAAAFRESLSHWVEHLRRMYPADTIILCVSDPSSRYWRHEVLPSYKSGRPMTMDQISWLLGRRVLLDTQDEWLPPGVALWVEDMMEADDLVAIGMTQGHVGYSNDKDLLTVPGLLWFRDEDYIRGIDPEKALRFFLKQVLVGDTCDGIPGCPGVGLKKADSLLKGTLKECWKAVRKAYEKAAVDPLPYAQVLRMKRSLDEPLWTPEVDDLT